MELKINRYSHGGSRIYLEDKNGNRNLICDTYGNEHLSHCIYETIIDQLEMGRDILSVKKTPGA